MKYGKHNRPMPRIRTNQCFMGGEKSLWEHPNGLPQFDNKAHKERVMRSHRRQAVQRGLAALFNPDEQENSNGNSQ